MRPWQTARRSRPEASNRVTLGTGSMNVIYVYNDNAIFAVAVGAAGGFGAYSYFRNVNGGVLAGASCLIAFDL